MSTPWALERRASACLKLIYRAWSPAASRILLVIGGTSSAIHCAPSSPAEPSPRTPAAVAAVDATPSAHPPAAASSADDSRGGRLYDNWRAEKGLAEAFAPDGAKTPEPDGKGGPNGNGTLNDGAGRPLLNTGHDYRLKNLFGWDLRGAQGVYGAAYQKKSYVLAKNLLSDARSAQEIQGWLTQGDEHTPAYGQVLDATDLADLSAFIVKTRDGALARPEQVYRLDADAPKNYALNAGADVARGRERYAATCSKCHGDDGRKLAIDETESVGTISRTSAYEIWFKIQNGHPASMMERQVSEASGADNARAILDILAALCDRKAFPPIAGQESKDVPDADLRCGDYLK
jgi:mono/diheme cytochrome c family protein